MHRLLATKTTKPVVCFWKNLGLQSMCETLLATGFRSTIKFYIRHSGKVATAKTFIQLHGFARTLEHMFST